jgi:hypothetical protein
MVLMTSMTSDDRSRPRESRWLHADFSGRVYEVVCDYDTHHQATKSVVKHLSRIDPKGGVNRANEG